VSREHRYEISAIQSSSLQDNTVCQKLAFRLLHMVKQRKQFAISILEIYVTKPLYSSLLQEIYPDSNVFLLNINEQKAIKTFFSQQSGKIPKQFDMIVLSPNCQFHQELFSFLETNLDLLHDEGIIAATFLGSQAFFEMQTCFHWLEETASIPYPLPPCSPDYWQHKLSQTNIDMEIVQEVQFRQSYHNSQSVFHTAALFGYFQRDLAIFDQQLLHQWMSAYDQGFRNKDGSVYTTFHLVDFIGRII
jgi:hypothetical protein